MDALFLAVAATRSAAFVAGLFLGFFAGLLATPAFLFWIARREWTAASRRARLTDQVIDRMERDEWPAPR
ncbi:MAG: hypothetical protein HY658_13110 [Actinobacteria bacterium]|nr:hypothetical protein [Actinomycetota bacterium]